MSKFSRFLSELNNAGWRDSDRVVQEYVSSLDEKTFDDLQQRITETLSYLRGYSEEQFEGSETTEVEVQTRVALLTFSGQD